MLRTAFRSAGLAVVILAVACSPPSPRVGSQSAAVATAASSLPQYLQATFRLGTITPDYASATVPALGDAEAFGFSASDGALAPLFTATSAVRANATLPATANGIVSVQDATSALGIDVSLVGATESAAQAVGGYVVYSQGYSGGADIVHRPTRNGTEDFFYFTTKPGAERVSYSVALHDVDGVRFVGETVEFLDATGAPRLHMADPYVIGADGRQYWADVRLSGCAADTDPTGPWGRPVTAPGASSCTIDIDWSQRAIPYPALMDPSWSTSITLMYPRAAHTATLLPSGYVLIAGGNGAGNHCELWRPGSPDTGASTGSLVTSTDSRFWHAAAPSSASHDVVIAGGQLGSSNTATAEVYCADTSCANYNQTVNGYTVTSGAWYPAGNMHYARAYLTATTLTNGEVLMTGGQDNSNNIQSSAELYTFSSATFANVSNAMTTGRIFHTATLLYGGSRVLITGGNGSTGPLSSAEVFTLNSADPAGSSTFNATGSMINQHYHHAAALVRGGNVLITGGPNSGAEEIYTPGDFSSNYGTFTGYYGMTISRYEHTANTLPGSVLIVGGYTGEGADGGAAPSTEFFVDTQTTSQQNTSGAALAYGRYLHTTTTANASSATVVAIGGSATDGTFVPETEDYKLISAGNTCDSTYPDLLCVNGKCSGSGNGDLCCDNSCECGTCNSSGTCSTNGVYGKDGSPSCGPYRCTATGKNCPVTCDEYTPCANTYYCSLAACISCPSTSAASTYSFTPNGDGYGGSTLQPYGTKVSGTGIKTGNFWGHIYPDLVEVSQNGTSIETFKGTSSGIASGNVGGHQTTYNSLEGSGYFYAVATGDFNGDGISDVAVTQNGSGYLYTMMSNGSGGFQTGHNAYSLGSTTQPVDLAAGDVNGDGKLDLVVATQNATISESGHTYGAFAVLLGNGDGTFQTPTFNPVPSQYGTYHAGHPNRIVLANFDGDTGGKLDVAVGLYGPYGAAAVWVLPGNGDGTFVWDSNTSDSTYATYLSESDISSTGGPDVEGLAAADFNKDGKIDIAYVDNDDYVSSVLTPELLLWTNSTTTAGKPGFTQQTNPDSITGGSSDVYTGLITDDFDNDTIPDLVAAQVTVGDHDGTIKLHSKYSASTNTFTHTTISSPTSNALTNPVALVSANFQYTANKCASLPDIVVAHVNYSSPGVVLGYYVNDFVNGSH